MTDEEIATMEKRLRTAYSECLGRSLPQFGLGDWNGYWDALRSAHTDVVAALRVEREANAKLREALERIDARRDSYAATDDPLSLFAELECMRTWARMALPLGDSEPEGAQ